MNVCSSKTIDWLFQNTLPEILTTFRPDLVLYDAGVDPHYDDELGKLSLTDEGIESIISYFS